MSRIVNTKDITTEEWLEWRKTGIGGSDAAAICGLSPWSSPISVWMDKTGKSINKEDNESMRQGRDLEAYVCDRFIEATGKKLRKINAILAHPEYEWMHANIDRDVVGENAGFEAKTTSFFNSSEWENGKVPVYYELQCMHYMAVTGADRWYIACLILGREFLWRVIERDEDVISRMISMEQEFWTINVIGEEMPYPDGSEESEDAIKSLYPSSQPDTQIELMGGVWEEAINRYYVLGEMLDKLQKEQDEIKQRINIEMGTNERCIIQGLSKPITWKSHTQKKLDSKKFKEDQPELFNKYTKTITVRKFMIPKKENDDECEG